jgi:hypothetical protein
VHRDELAVVTCYFNPGGFRRRRQNYERFREGMRNAAVTCMTVECAFGTTPFELAPALDVLHVRSDSLLWQKERLLNLAAQALPATVRGIAWLDCDIVFRNVAWPSDLASRLSTHPVAQVFETF